MNNQCALCLAIMVLLVSIMAPGILMSQDGTSTSSKARFLPMLDPDFDAEPVLYLKSGIMNLSGRSGSGVSVGAELAFNCFMFEPAVGKIRPHLSVNVHKDERFTVSTIELNPTYVYYITQRISIGVGPGVGYLIAHSGDAASSWSAQAGVILGYDVSPVQIAIESRYQWQSREDSLPAYIDNLRTSVKVGVAL